MKSTMVVKVTEEPKGCLGLFTVDVQTVVKN
jgi:hypothetical protein